MMSKRSKGTMKLKEILSATDKNNLDLHSMGKIPYLRAKLEVKPLVSVKNMSPSLSRGRCLSGVQFITSLISKLCICLTTYSTTVNNIINSQARDTTSLKTNVFLT